MPTDVKAVTALLSGAGFIAAEEEAAELLARAAGDVELLDSLVRRRLTGEPLAWVTGNVSFCGLEIRVDPGVYVPRWQSEPLARRAVERLPANGVAIDLCTGTGAIAKTMVAHRPGARVVASDVDKRAVACATANGVEVYCGDLFAPVPGTLEGRVDVVVGVVPYVPAHELPLLQRDTFTFESPLSYDGGRDGTDILRRVLTESPRFLRHGGALLLELGGEQADALGDEFARLGYLDVTVLVDEDGDVRGVEATLGDRRCSAGTVTAHAGAAPPDLRSLQGAEPAAGRISLMVTASSAPHEAPAITEPPADRARFETKVAVVVRHDLAVWQKLNVAAFLASGIGGSVDGIIGRPYADADGTAYLAMCRQPITILEGDAAGLAASLRRALERDLRVAVYTAEMFATTNDDDNRAAVLAVRRDLLDLVGLAVYGPRGAVDKALKNARLQR